MPVETEKFAIDRVDLFKILVRIYLESRKWFYLLFFIIFLLFLSLNSRYAFILAGVVVFVLLTYLAYLWFYSASKENNIFFIGRQISFDDDQLRASMEDGSSSEFILDNLVKVKKLWDYYLLYISKNQFFHVPLSSFKSDSDIEYFLELLRSRNLIT